MDYSDTQYDNWLWDKLMAASLYAPELYDTDRYIWTPDKAIVYFI